LFAPILWWKEVSRKRYRRLPANRRRHERQRGIKQQRDYILRYPEDVESLVTALVMRMSTWAAIGGVSIVVTLLLSFLGEDAVQETELLYVSVCVVVAFMCMALLHFIVAYSKFLFAYSKVVSDAFSRRNNSPSHGSQLGDTFILFLARPSNFEGILGILFGIFGYAIGHEMVWGDR